jgi:hypothetical protein
VKHPSYGALHTDRQTDRQSDMAFFFLRMRLLASPFGLAIIKQQAFVGGACVCHGHFGGGACVCVNTGSSPKMEHAQTCPSPPDVVAVMTQSLMTQKPASPPDVSP